MNDQQQFYTIMEALGRIEAKVDGHLVDDVRVHDRHERAIGDLFTKSGEHDRFRARVKGGYVVVGALGSLVALYHSFAGAVPW